MSTRKLVMSALFIALGIVIPIAFHQFQMGGQTFLPMHLPVLIGGMLLGPRYGMLIGFITPVLSSLLTSMPPVYPMLPIMFFELGIYGFTSGYLYRIFKGNIYLSLIISMLAGRIGASIVVFFMTKFFAFQGPGFFAYIKGGILTGLPGIIIQLVFVPLVVKLLERGLKGRI